MTRNPNTSVGPVYGRTLRGAVLASLALCVGLFAAAPPVQAQAGDATIVDAREAFRKKDRSRMTALRSVAVNARLRSRCGPTTGS